MGLTSSRSRLSALYQVSQKYHKELYSTATFGLESWTGLLKKVALPDAIPFERRRE